MINRFPWRFRRSTSKVVILLCLLKTASLHLFAQEQILFRQLEKKNGLSQSSVFAIAQDVDGFMWFGTRDGLNRYDGINMKVFRHDKSRKSLICNDIRVLHADHRTGHLWIGTLQGLSRYDRETESFTNYLFNEEDAQNLPSNNIRCVFQDSKGRTWIGTRKGLFLYRKKIDQFQKIKGDSTSSVSIANQDIKVVYEDENLDLWIGSKDGLYQLQEKPKDEFWVQRLLSDKTSHLYLKDQHIETILQDPEGNFWIGTHSAGLFCWKKKQNQLIHYDDEAPRSISHHNIRDLSLDPKGKLWVATQSGLNRFDSEKQKFDLIYGDQTDPSSLGNSSILNIFFDSRGSIWVGTYHQGVHFYHQDIHRFRNFFKTMDSRSIGNNVINCMTEDEKGNLWIGTGGGGLNYYSYQKGLLNTIESSPAKPQGLSDNNVKAILKDGQYLWIGTLQQGMDRYDLQTKQFLHFKHEEKDSNSVAHNSVYSLFREGSQLWIATFGGGLDYYDLETNQFVHHYFDKSDTTSISSNLCRTINQDAHGQLWVGTENGLNLLKKSAKSGQSIEFQRYLSGVNICRVLATERGVIWVGSFAQGLFRLDPTSNEYIQYNTGDGLPGNSVLGILEDQSGNLWISTNNGISKFNPSKERFTNYNHADGLKNLEFNFNAHHQSSTGEMLFGGNKGFTLFNPENIVQNDFPPPVVFTELEVSNRVVYPEDESGLTSRSINLTESLTLRYNEANFSIGFSALDFFNPTNNHYRYILEGLEKEWTETRGQTKVSYTIQKPGTYHFKLQGGNNNSVWNPELRILEIKVLPPPWLSPLAYAGYTLLFLIVVFGSAYFLRLKHHLQLEQVQKKQQEKLHELKLRFFTNITHELKTPLTLIHGPLEDILSRKTESKKTLKQLRSIQVNTRRLLNLVNQILIFRKLEADHLRMEAVPGDLIQFLKQIYFSFKEEASLRSINYRFYAQDKEIKLWFDQDKLEKVFFNLLSNAFKYTPNKGSIGIRVLRAEEVVKVEVFDNGKGIEKELHQQIFNRFYEKEIPFKHSFKGTGIGLALSKQMIELHGGQIDVESRPSQGACFTVLLPLGKEHLKPEERKAKEMIPLTLPIPPGNAKEHRLLIVEDDAEVSDFIRSIFADRYQVWITSNGQEGLKVTQKMKPDLILCDIRMPKMDGMVFTHRIKENIETSHVPIILLTAMDPDTFKLKGLRTGADDFISKPFSPEELKVKVHNLIQSREALRKRFIRSKKMEPKEVTVTSADEKFLENAMAIMEKHMDNKSFSVDQFAFEMAVSRPLLFNKIKALTNLTPNNFVKMVRLKRAAQLLRQQKLNVSEVADRVGFRDPKYFSKCFQKQFKATPSGFIHNQT